MKEENKEINMSIGAIAEMSKKEYIDAINDITKKYQLPLYILNIIIKQISDTISNQSLMQINQELENFKNEEK